MPDAWPDRPTCHDRDPNAARFEAIQWRPPRGRSGLEDPYDRPFRTCSYCGCVHPCDLMDLAAEHELQLEMADWKYGWPHKFYIEGIPNPAEGQTVLHYGYAARDRLLAMAAPGYKPEPYDDCGRGWRVVVGTGTAPRTVVAKWYNLHLVDLTGEAFAQVTDFIARQSGIRFAFDGERLSFRSEHATT